jgi:hypothetical protein
MAFTRDANHGKGEHELTYRMILIWYRVFPTLAIYFLHQLVQYGSWRDFPYLCQHVYTSEGACSALIDVCVELMNRQFEKDWFSVCTGHYTSISYVAKWIPREYKKFDWLYSRCVREWAMRNHPHFFQYAVLFPSYYKAIVKCKRMYRKQLSRLNHILDTTEIKQCSQEDSLLIPKNVSKYTLMKQPGMVFSDSELVSSLEERGASMEESMEESMEATTEKEICRHHFQQYYDKCLFSSSKKGRTKQTGILLPVSSYIKRAFGLMDSGNTTGSPARLLNKQWSIFSKQVLPKYLSREPFLPLLDVSLKMQLEPDDSFYTALGMAILVAQKSLLGRRIVMVDQFPTWIDFSESTSLIETVTLIRLKLRSSQNTVAHFQKAWDILSYWGNKQPALNHSFRLVVFSSFSKNVFDCSLWDGEHGSFFEPFRNSFQGECPLIVFWNVSRTGQLPCSPSQPGCFLFSGFSVGFLNQLFLLKDGQRFPTMYDHISSMVSAKPFSRLSRYIDMYCH